MPDHAPRSGTRSNVASGTVEGPLLQVGDVHGNIHVYDSATPKGRPDVCLDIPRRATPLRGRQSILEELTHALTHRDGRVRVLAGAGGIGKSAIAATLAQRAEAARMNVFWVRPGMVAESMVETAIEMGGDHTHAARLADTPRRAARWVWRVLAAAEEPWLLVFDNVDRPGELDPDNPAGAGIGWLKGSDRGLVVVTTRVAEPSVWGPAVIHRVAELGTADAAAALADHAGLTDPDGATNLARRLGGFPLALALAGRVVASHGPLFTSFDAFNSHLGDAARLDGLAASAEPSQQGLAATWSVSSELLADTPHAAPLLELLSVLAADGTEVPMHRLTVAELRGSHLDSEGALDEVAVARAVNTLATQGLISIGSIGLSPVLRMHPLIAEITRSGLADRAEPVTHLAEQLLNTQLDQNLAFDQAAFGVVSEVRSRALGADHPATLAARVARSRAATLRQPPTVRDEEEAAAVADRAWVSLGARHPVALLALHHHGDVLNVAGRLTAATEVYERELELHRDIDGPESQGALSARHQLALVALKSGDLDRAEDGFQALLAIKERTAGPFDATALFARANLGAVAMQRGHWHDAERYLYDVLARRQEHLGPDHPDTTHARYYLAELGWARGEATKAEVTLLRVIREWETSVGSDDPRTTAARGRLVEIRSTDTGHPYED